MAFLGRYGRQPRDQVMRLTYREASDLMDAVADLIKDERRSGDEDG